MPPTVLDARSQAQSEASVSSESSELLQLSSIDLLLQRMSWAAELAGGGVVLYNQDEDTCDADIHELEEVRETDRSSMSWTLVFISRLSHPKHQHMHFADMGVCFHVC
jgi:hypothetical protein